jgi:hypothetical protein
VLLGEGSIEPVVDVDVDCEGRGDTDPELVRLQLEVGDGTCVFVGEGD